MHYLPPQGYQPSSFSTQPQAAWQTTTSYTSTFNPVTAASTFQASQSNSATTEKPTEDSSTSTLNSLPASISLTPNLIQQVNSAASSNPILANLLQLAAAGNASQDQLKTLGLLIQSFASLSSSATQFQPSSHYQAMHTLPPVKEFDLVFELSETPNDRWYIPRVPVYAERKPSPDVPSELDVSLLTCVPFKSNAAPQNADQTAEEPSLQYQVTLILKNAPYTVWETVWRWIGGEAKNKANKVEIEGQVCMTTPYLHSAYLISLSNPLPDFIWDINYPQVHY